MSLIRFNPVGLQESKVSTAIDVEYWTIFLHYKDSKSVTVALTDYSSRQFLTHGKKYLYSLLLPSGLMGAMLLLEGTYNVLIDYSYFCKTPVIKQKDVYQSECYPRPEYGKYCTYIVGCGLERVSVASLGLWSYDFRTYFDKHLWKKKQLSQFKN